MAARFPPGPVSPSTGGTGGSIGLLWRAVRILWLARDAAQASRLGSLPLDARSRPQRPPRVALDVSDTFRDEAVVLGCPGRPARSSHLRLSAERSGRRRRIRGHPKVVVTGGISRLAP